MKHGNAVITGDRAMAGRMSSEERETITLRNVHILSRQITSTSASELTGNDVANERPAIEERLAAKMFSYEIVCFFLVITFTVLAALHSS